MAQRWRGRRGRTRRTRRTRTVGGRGEGGKAGEGSNGSAVAVGLAVADVDEGEWDGGGTAEGSEAAGMAMERKEVAGEARGRRWTSASDVH